MTTSGVFFVVREPTSIFTIGRTSVSTLRSCPIYIRSVGDAIEPSTGSGISLANIVLRFPLEDNVLAKQPFIPTYDLEDLLAQCKKSYPGKLSEACWQFISQVAGVFPELLWERWLVRVALEIPTGYKWVQRESFFFNLRDRHCRWTKKDVPETYLDVARWISDYFRLFSWKLPRIPSLWNVETLENLPSYLRLDDEVSLEELENTLARYVLQIQKAKIEGISIPSDIYDAAMKAFSQYRALQSQREKKKKDSYGLAFEIADTFGEIIEKRNPDDMENNPEAPSPGEPDLPMETD